MSALRPYAALALGVVAAALFTRLGRWQLDRRAERQARNAVLAARLLQPVLVLSGSAALRPLDPDTLHFRRATATGVFDFPQQVVEAGRSYRGSPGVHVLTPLRLGDGSGVLVDRGWAYAPDGRTVASDQLVEPDTAQVEGILVRPAGRFSVRPDSVRVGYGLFPLVLRRAGPSSGALPPGLRPAELPALDAGPHLAYALQWFSFALIALVGGALLTRRDLRSRTPGAVAG